MSKKNIAYLATAIAYLLLFTACSKKQADEIKAENPSTPAEAVTYSNFVGALLESRCSACHAMGRQAAPIFTLNGYASVTANAERIRNAVLVKKSMPIGTSLPAAELKSLQAWFDAGMPQ